jgi:hypothetical protein
MMALTNEVQCRMMALSDEVQVQVQSCSRAIEGKPAACGCWQRGLDAPAPACWSHTRTALAPPGRVWGLHAL